MTSISGITTISPNDALSVIGTTPGPENTIIMTFENQVSIYPTLSSNLNDFSRPAKSYPLQISKKISFFSKITKFTSNVVYDPFSEYFAVICDHRYLLTWPTLSQASCADGRIISLISEADVASGLRIHHISLNPLGNGFLFILDSFGRLHNFLIPLPLDELPTKDDKKDPKNKKTKNNNNNNNKDDKRGLNTQQYLPIPTLPKIKKKSHHPTQPVPHTPPVIMWCGLISLDFYLVATSVGMIVYDISDHNNIIIADEVYYPYALSTSELSRASLSSTLHHAEVPITFVSSYNSVVVDPSSQIALKGNQIVKVVPQAVLYADGHLELFTFSTILKKFDLVYSRRLSNSYVSPLSIPTILGENHIAIVTPRSPKTHLGANATDSKDPSHVLVLDMNYYTIDAYKAVYKPVGEIPRENQHGQTLFHNTVSLEKRAISFFCAQNLVYAITFQLETPTLASTIGSATRDAKFWSNVAIVSRRTGFGGGDVIIEAKKNDDQNNGDKNAKSINKNVPIKNNGIKTLTRPNSFLTTSNHFGTMSFISSIPSISLEYPNSLFQNEQSILSETQEVCLNATGAKDPLLALSGKTIPILNPFGSIPTNLSFSNYIDRNEPPTPLLSSTSTVNTQSLDQIILANWQSYFQKCTTDERVALKSLLPRLGQYLLDSSDKGIEAGSNNGNKRDAFEAMMSSKRKLDGSMIQNLTDLTADAFLFKFFAFCSSWSNSTPQACSVLSIDQQYSLKQKHGICSCSLSHMVPFGDDVQIEQKVNNGDIPEHEQESVVEKNDQNVENVENIENIENIEKAGRSKRKKDKQLLKKSAIQKAIAVSFESQINQRPQNFPPITHNSSKSTQKFLTQILFEPCAWKAILASVLSLSGSHFDSHLRKLLFFYNSSFLQSQHQHLLPTYISSPIAPYCQSAPKLFMAKPLSPLFSHLIFRECIRRLDSVCCPNCPNMLFLLPLQVLISNSMLSSILSVTCLNVGLKNKMWGLVNSVVSAANVSHSDVFFDLLDGLIDELSTDYMTHLPAIIAIIENDEDDDDDDDDDEEEKMEEMVEGKNVEKVEKVEKIDTKKSKKNVKKLATPSITPTITPTIATNKQGFVQVNINDDNSNQIDMETFELNDAVYQSGNYIENLISNNNIGNFISSKKCSCDKNLTLPLFSQQSSNTSELQKKFSSLYPNISTFLTATLPQPSPSCVFYSLLNSQITKPLLVKHLSTMKFENALVLLNLLVVILQSRLINSPLPDWLNCNDCLQYLSIDTLLTWITMLIDSHTKSFLIAPHLLPQDQHSSLLVFASLHKILGQFCTNNPQLFESVAGMAQQLQQFQQNGQTKLNVVEPYSIQVMKF